MYLVTGAAGFVGRAVIEQLVADGQKVRALVMKNDPLAQYLPKEVRQMTGDLVTGEGLDAFFDLPGGEEATVIHTAGIISIAWKKLPEVEQVNVGGTRRIIEGCLKHACRLIHVASVHAIREKPRGQTMAEPEDFQPDCMVGGYAKTKTEAALLVQDAALRHGLRAAIVLPSGILGPGDYAGNNVSTMMRDVLRNRMPIGILGGYDFVDVRDVADGILRLCSRPELNGCFNLTGHYVTIRQYFGAIYQAAGSGVHRACFYAPAWAARLALPFYMLADRISKRTPVFTRYSLYTLTTNASFSFEKARRLLGYSPRPFEETVRDTVQWMRTHGIA